MAHLVEEYAKNLGVKFSRPVLKDHFFPINFDKYITISKDSSRKNYRIQTLSLFWDGY